jgi:hypothetical protein
MAKKRRRKYVEKPDPALPRRSAKELRLETCLGMYYLRLVWALRDDGQIILYALASSVTIAKQYRKMALMEPRVIRAKIELAPLDHVFGSSVWSASVVQNAKGKL